MTQFSCFSLSVPQCWHYQYDMILPDLCHYLQKIATQPSPEKIAYIRAFCPLFDETASWAAALQGTEYRRTLLRKVQSFQRLLEILRAAPFPIVFLTGYSVTGTAWELALACHHRGTWQTQHPIASKIDFVAQSGDPEEAEEWAKSILPLRASSKACESFCAELRQLEIDAAAEKLSTSITKEAIALTKRYFQPGVAEGIEKQAYTVSLQQRNPMFSSASSSIKKQVRIRLTLQLPPVKAIERLLGTGWYCIFFHEEPRTLASLLNQLYLKLADALSPQEMLRWKTQVSWFSSESAETTALDFMEWQHTEIFFLQTQGKCAQFLRWSGNTLEADGGWCEPMKPGEDMTPFIPLLTDTGQALLPVAPISMDMPWCVWIRSFFLEEFLLRGYFATPREALVLLEKAGWQLAPSWKDPIRIEIPMPQAPASSLYLGSLLVAGICTLLLQEKGIPLSTANLWVTQCLGLPSHAAAPSRGLQQLGRARTLAYTERFWPQWMPLVTARWQVSPEIETTESPLL